MSFLFGTSIYLIFLLPFVISFNSYYPENRVSYKTFATSPNDTAYILPTHLKPTLYELTILPFLNNGTFQGWVDITFDVLAATNVIVLNGDTDFIPLSSMTASVTIHSQSYPVTLSSDNTHQMIKFTLSDALEVQQNVRIGIVYSGIMADDMQGLYLSSYVTSGTNRLMAITKFESTFARRVFPCFDEPAYRANFVVKIYRSTNQNSLANMPLDSSAPDQSIGMVLDTYKQTPSMPTYLLAFGVSELGHRSDNKTLRVFARPDVIADTSYVVSVGQTILNKLGNFTGIQYPLPKMDLVAVPDFDAGAMENWGLTTYREKYLMYNSKLNTWQDKFKVLSVVAHELSHQWFGDLVTPLSWEYSWLNEAFATYFQYTSNKLFPEWDQDDTMFVMQAVHSSLEEDVGIPRPMTSPVYTPDQIKKIFDYVIYQKGGSILRMTEYFLTQAVWRAGLNKYLTTYQYGTGTPEELFSALQEAAAGTSTGLTNVNETLQGWTTQPGYPLITVTLLSSNTNSSVYKVVQLPYDLDSSYAYLSWNVPLTYTTQSEAQFDATKANRHWLLPSYPSSYKVFTNGSGWVIFNINQVGYYRVNYDAENWAKLKAQLDSDFSAIGAINRAQILDDAFHLAKTRQLDYNTAFGLTSYMQNETALAPWNAFLFNFRFLLTTFIDTPAAAGLKKYMTDTLAVPYQNLTANLKMLNDKPMSPAWLVGWFACELDLPDCSAVSKQLFNNWRKDPQTYQVLPNQKQTVLCTGLRLNPNLEAFMDVWNYFLKSKNGAERYTLMTAMACVTNKNVVTMYLDNVCNVDANYVRLQDRWIAFQLMVDRQSGVSNGLEYIANNFAKVSNALGSGLSAVIETIGNTITRRAQIAQVHSILNNASVDQNLKVMLNSTVLPAIAKRQAFATSPQGSAVKAWAEAYIGSSASYTVANMLMIMLSIAVFVIHY